jgi:RNA polymerase sigma-70 factor (ECF subfamily)
MIMSDADRDLAQTLESFRGYLQLLARLQLTPQVQQKLDASDVVQLTMMKAVESLDQFRGETEAELAGWLRQILSRQLANAVRDLGRDKRDVARERSLEAAQNESSARLEAWLAAEQSSPSEQAVRNEEVFRLAEALASLPEAQCEALTLHHLHSWKLTEISLHMDRSETAVAGLIKRGLQTLRRQLTDH